MLGGPAVLAGAYGVGATPTAANPEGLAVPGRTALLGAACLRPDGRFGARLLAPDGRSWREVLLPGRGHDLTYCPVSRRVVVFARRPGTFALSLSVDANQPDIVFEAPEDRHFYGHGVVSPDGRLLYATENDFENGRGVIGIYDVGAGYARIGEWPTHGEGPHDLAIIPQRDILVVANGGYREHPDLGGGRRILNAETFRTSLVYLDMKTGDLLERHDLPANSRVSLRHLDIGRNGLVVLGAQVPAGKHGQNVSDVPLLFTGRIGEALKPIPLGPANGILAGYVSSVAVDKDGHRAGITSSRGGQVMVVNLATGQVVATHRLVDVSGVAPDNAGGGFFVSSGGGDLRQVSERQSAVITRSHDHWDNHMIALGVQV